MPKTEAQKAAEQAHFNQLRARFGDQPNLQQLHDAGAVFVISHSGGKDSQAATLHTRSLLPEGARCVLVHAELPEADWDGIVDHITATAPDLKLYTCQAIWNDGSKKTFLDMVRDRGEWPSPKQRQCTSDLKRTPIEVVIRRICKEYNTKLIVSIDGRRAAESDDRAALSTWSVNERLSKPASRVAPSRAVFDWLPIHSFSTDQVFATIADAGQAPHWAYQAGMSRLSCCFCIMAKKSDLQTAARLRPELFAKYVAMEQEIGRTFQMPKGKKLWLTDIVQQVQAETELALAA